ncbi:MAG: hypothetical protein H6814_08960 [Phycisphaeraceae bacterium]|nr:hypothetical protein [Phycisphaeraceae bacterium]
MTTSPFGGDIASCGLPVDISILTHSINGVEMPELKVGAIGVTLPDGSVREQQHRALAMLRDGTIVDAIQDSIRCDYCAAEVAHLAQREGLTPFEELVASRHHRSNIARSVLTGIPLCCRHQVRFTLGGGRIVVISPNEEAALRKQCNDRRSLMIEVLCEYVPDHAPRALT